MDHYEKAYPVFSKIRGFYRRRFQNMLLSLRRFSKSEVAQLRMKIIKFYEEYGRNETKKAFGVDRRLISKWRKRLKKSGGRLGCPKINAHIERYNRTIQKEKYRKCP
jgi:transposase-like protein